MGDCKHLKTIDMCDLISDIFDHPTYHYECKLTGKELKCVDYFCNARRCKNYTEETEGD